MITSASRISDLEKVLDALDVMMTATATNGLWTVVLNDRQSLRSAERVSMRTHQHISSGVTLFDALRLAIEGYAKQERIKP